MSRQAQARIDAETEPANPRVIATSETLRPGSQSIIINTDAGEVTITLADMAECAGNIVSFVAPDGNAKDSAFIKVNETGNAPTGVGDMDVDDDYIILFCTGREWLVLATDTL